MNKKPLKCLLISLISLVSIASCSSIDEPLLTDPENQEETQTEEEVNNPTSEQSETKEETKTDDKQDDKEDPKEEDPKPEPEEPKEEEPKPEEPPVVEKYKVTWYNGSTVLETDNDVVKGTTPIYNGKTPTKASDNDYDYTFIGWNTNSKATSALNPLPAVDKNLDLYAIFSAKAITKYTVKFFNQGKEITNSSKTVKPGKYNIKSDLYSLSNPTKASDSENTYTFSGWATNRPTNDISNSVITEITVSSNISLHACFASTKNTYTITWMNGSTKYDTTTHAYGETPKPSKSDPTKASTSQYDYTFLGWNNSSSATTALSTLPTVTKNDTYYAVYKSVAKTYNVTFYYDINYDSSITEKVIHGNKPTLKDVNAGDEERHYSNFYFLGWNTVPNATTAKYTKASDFPTITADTPFYAVYKEEFKQLTLTWYLDEELSNQYVDPKTYSYHFEDDGLRHPHMYDVSKYAGPTPTAKKTPPEGYKYKFVGWKYGFYPNLYQSKDLVYESAGSSKASTSFLVEMLSHVYLYPVFEKVQMAGAFYGENNSKFYAWNWLTTNGYLSVNSKTVTGNKTKLNNLSNLKLVIDDSITGIGNDAFSGCTTLTGIDITNSKCTTIGQRAFKDCVNLVGTEVKALNDSLQEIKSNAFENCKVEDIDLPKTIRYIRSYAFKDIILTQYPYGLPTMLGVDIFGLTADEIRSLVTFEENWNSSGAATYQVRSVIVNGESYKYEPVYKNF